MTAPTHKHWNRLFAAADDEGIKIEIVLERVSKKPYWEFETSKGNWWPQWDERVFLILRRGEYSIKRELDQNVYHTDPVASFEFVMSLIREFVRYIISKKVFNPEPEAKE